MLAILVKCHSVDSDPSTSQGKRSPLFKLSSFGRSIVHPSAPHSLPPVNGANEEQQLSMPCLRGQLPAGVLARNAAALNFIHRIGRPCSIFLKWPAIEVKVRFYLDPRPGAGIDLDDPVLSRYQAPRALAVIDPHLDPLVRDCLPV